MARSRFQTVVQDEEGDIQAGRVLTLYETDGTTPIAQTLYDAPSGGSTVITPTTNSLGYVELFTDLPQRVKVAVTGVSGQYDSDLSPDPSDVVLKTASQTLTNKTLTSPTINTPIINTPAIDAPSVTGGMSVTRNSASPAATFRNTNAGSYALLVENVNGDDILKVARNGSNDAVAINLVNGIVPASSTFLVAKDVSSGAGFVMADFDIQVSGAAGDVGAMRANTHQAAAGAGTLLRAGEFHTMRYAAAPGGAGTWVLELGLHTEVAGAGVGDNVGIRLTSENWAGSPVMSSAVRADTGLLLAGAAGWKQAIHYLDTDGTTVLFSVSQTGQMTSGHHISRTNDTYDLGSAANRWVRVYSNAILLESGGAAGPAYTFRSDTTTGLFLQANNVLGVTTAGVEAFRISAAGLLDWRRSQNITPGGGATATMTVAIGGSGPAAANIAGWIKQAVNGTAVFVPYWI